MQRAWCAALATVVTAGLAWPPARSPDGVEMIAMVEGWFAGPSGVAPWYWPPL